MPSTLMGQFMEALNSQTNLDDLGINLESFQGGLECNVDEVYINIHINDMIYVFMFNNNYLMYNLSFIKICIYIYCAQVIQSELNIDGLLDINIPITNHNSNGSHTNTTQSNSIGSISLPQTQSTTSHSKVQYPQTSVTSPSWVH